MKKQCTIVLIAWALVMPWSVVAEEAPGEIAEIVVIDALSDWFGSVSFEHSFHMEIAEDCESCHHHSDGEAVACATCHEPSRGALTTEPPSLEAAFHLSCMGCHEEVDAPSGCTDCHARARLPEGASLSYSDLGSDPS